MLRYSQRLTARARQLRLSMTESEHRLWRHLRRKQILGVRFYRQRPIGNYIVDFYAPAPKLVVEADGSQHFSDSGLKRDADRDAFLQAQGIEVLRFTNLEVLGNIGAVAECIRSVVERRLQP